MPPFDGPLTWTKACMGSMRIAHAQLATAENLTTLSFLTACYSRILQIRETSFTVLYKEIPPVCNIVAFKRAIFNILNTVGEPKFGPNVSFKVIISQTFS
jgi:hypothetical protein